MATLSTNAQTRWGANYLIQLSGADQAATGTTLDTTRIDAAGTDAEADIAIYCGVAYDGTDARHVAAGVEGVIAYLRSRAPGASSEARSSVQSWRTSLKNGLALVTGRDRVTPDSTSELTPSDENPDDRDDVRPAFDSRHFVDIIPASPSEGAGTVLD